MSKNAEHELIRLASRNPKVRAKLKEAGILDRLWKKYKEAGEFTQQEWETHIQKHPNADPKDHTITKGDSKGKSEGNPLSKLELSDRTKKRVKDLVEELTPIIHDPEDEYGDKDFKEEVYDLIKENSPMFSHSNQDIKDAVDALLSKVKKNKPSGKQASLRAKLIRLAHEKPELRSKLLPLIKEAKDPSYQNYLDDKKKKGEKPLSEEDWKSKVLGKPKDEKGSEDGDSKSKKSKNFMDPKDYSDALDAAGYVDMDEVGKNCPAIKGFVGGSYRDKATHAGKLFGLSEKEIESHFDAVDDVVEGKKIPGFQTAYQALSQTMAELYDLSDGSSNEDMEDSVSAFHSALGDEKKALKTMGISEQNPSSKVQAGALKMISKAVKEIQKQIAEETNIDISDGGYDLKWAKKASTTRSKLIRLAYAKPELREKILPLLTKEAKDPSYQDYLDKKKKDGEKPLSEEDWKSKVLGKSEKDEKGSEDGGSKSKNFMDPKDYSDAEDASAYVDMDDLGKSVSAIKGFIGGSSKDKQTHAGKLFGFSEKEIEGHFDYKNGDRGPDIKEIPGFQTAYQALNQTMGNLFNSDGSSVEGEMMDFATEFNDALGDEDAFLQTMSMSRSNSSKVQREAMKMVSKAVKEIQKQIANETNIDISDGGYDLKWAKKASKTANRMPALSWVIPYAEKEGAREETFLNGGVRVWRWETEFQDRRTGKVHTKYHLVVASGNKRARRAMVYEYHHKAASRDQKVDRIVANMQAKLDAKAKAREEAMNFQHGYQVGDILYASWGYDQTNVDFYQVTRLVGAKMIEIQMISSKGAGRDRVIPVPNRFVSGERPFKVKVRTNRSVKTRGGVANAYPWDGKPKYETSPYAGH